MYFTGLKKSKMGDQEKESKTKQSKGIRDDIEEADDEESYYKWLAENPNAGRSKFVDLE